MPQSWRLTSHFPLPMEGQAFALAAGHLLNTSGPLRGPPSTCLGVGVLVGFYLSVARVMHQLSSLAAAPESLSLYIHCTVPPLSTQCSGHVTRPPYGGLVSQARVWVGLSLGGATFVLPWGMRQTPRHAALFLHLYLYCDPSPLSNKFRPHVNGPPDGGPGIQACVLLRLCLGEGLLSGLPVSIGSRTGSIVPVPPQRSPTSFPKMQWAHHLTSTWRSGVENTCLCGPASGSGIS